ncbi:hypothetical protein FA15DRAFT_663846 [Coprinopsis marcescibilis]|uniref:Uncharacterized protein n=1 Tax=Coprinopsis marcescibilis TaxID=230819 RepID=A0A5C3LLW9_COPMA|nr:hypothetical protein FA15DRAFT_663846 [Coprinopsis marcescibilis]
MESKSSSRTPIKVTYLGRAKPKRTSSQHAGAQSDSSSDSESNQPSPPARTFLKPQSPQKSMAKEALNAKPPTVVKQAPKQSDAPSRSNSSIKQPLKDTASVTKPISKARSVAQSLRDEDEGSVAESIAESTITSGRISRTVKDRQEYFKNQSDCAAFGPYRALCSRCKHFVNLNRSQTYAVTPWERHRAKCDQELASEAALPANADEMVNLPPSQIFGELPVRRSASERRAYLLSEKNIEVVEEGRVKCNSCSNWVTLKKGQPYDLTKWKQHKERCVQDTPSDRILTAERKLAIINDPQVKSFDSTSIECSKCDQKIVGTSGKEYDLEAWESHKEQCREAAEPQQPEGTVSSVPFPAVKSGEPSSSVASTEDTLVAASGHESTRGAKRPREEETSETVLEEDERPANRKRSEIYEPPIQDAPTPMGWILLPFKSFVRGFRQSLKNSSSE